MAYNCIYLKDTRNFPCEIERVFAHEEFNLCIDEYREKYFKDGFVTCFTDLGLKEFIQASAKRVYGNSLSVYSELQILSEKSAKEVRKHVRTHFGAKVELSNYAYLNKLDEDLYNLIETNTPPNGIEYEKQKFRS